MDTGGMPAATVRRPGRSLAWEALVVYGGRELAVDAPQTIRDALSYRGRLRAYPGAIIRMKSRQ
jgi:hypothetical protein